MDSGAALLYYQGRSLERLGESRKAKVIFESLVEVGRDTGAPKPGSDFFAKFGERGSARLRSAQAHYLAGLGQLGLNQPTIARAEFQKAVELNVYHLDARTQLNSLQ